MVVERLLTLFEHQHIRYGLMGGFALGLWGAPRATVEGAVGIMKMLSHAAEQELRDVSRSLKVGEDMKAVAAGRHNPFVKDGRVDADAYLVFLTEFNAFINHEPRRFKPIKDADMRL